MLADPHLRERDMIVVWISRRVGFTKRSDLRIKLSDPDTRVRPPLLGEHTDALLTRWRGRTQEAKRLRDAGSCRRRFTA